MRKFLLAVLSLVCANVLGQIEQNVNKTTGTESNAISDIDSIRFNTNQTEMEIIFNNGGIESHSISEINNVTFSGDAELYPPNTVHCGDPTEVIDVINPVTGKTWMDRNLGAKRVAISATDEDAYGDLYQWGRGADGHQCINSQTTSQLSTADQPNHNMFILTSNQNNWDWRNPQSNDLWQGINGINNPCPVGYRIPTEVEYNDEIDSWISDNTIGAFASQLKLTLTGYRTFSGGTFSQVGNLAHYWSSTDVGIYSRAMIFSAFEANTVTFLRANGCSVRCIKD